VVQTGLDYPIGWSIELLKLAGPAKRFSNIIFFLNEGIIF